MERTRSRLMGDILKEILKDNLDQGLLFAKICDTYNFVVSPNFVRATTDKTFQDGILICKTSSSVARAQLTMNAEAIKRKINKQLGSIVVEKIICT